MPWPRGVPASNAKVSDEEVIAALKAAGGNRADAATALGIRERVLYHRMQGIEAKGLSVPEGGKNAKKRITHNAFYKEQIRDGVVLVGTDPHYWPNEFTTCQRGFLHFVRHMEPRPKTIVLNGDVFDGARVSRHPKIGFMERRPTVADELRVCQERLTEIEDAAPPGCSLVWPLGNHDLRYEAFLAANAPEYEHVEGMHLKDRFPLWQPCWSFWINEGEPGWTEIKHRFKGGIHATYNNAMRAGVSVVTGHLHSLKVYPWTDRRGTRYGIDAGTLAEVEGDQIGAQFVNYLEANPVDWRSGFVVLTFKDGRLMWPEIATKWDEDHIEFRGNLIRV